MWKADVDLVRRLHSQGLIQGQVIDAGGFSDPCIADYDITIAAMAELQKKSHTPYRDELSSEDVEAAQKARYLGTHLPFSFLGDYEIENPESGGKRIEDLEPGKYGTVLCFSVLEHCPFPGVIATSLRKALKPGGLLVLSVPFQFPYHDQIDYWRLSPEALRVLFGAWDIVECGWHLQIPADAGVLCTRTWKPQIIEASYIVARA